ncbi:hypothetical protein XA68_11046 [Ophiocordyceps unilateralis]|uniref:Synaptobrevin n=1 Tax=Ophiocordyceps unilateralis TaxID=268505 RepID=A0A2A9PHL5_OPHUN|nr:hypothetical protein XA68_11046 [Ophiocordyceps unilateralis]
MVRLVQGLLADGVKTPHDASLLQLSQLLSRLEQNVLRPSAEREQQLLTSEYERKRVGANVEYARKLLANLEQELTAIKAPTRRHEVQEALHAAGEIVDSLEDRLADLRHLAMDQDESSGEEQHPADIVPTPSTSATDTRGSSNLDEDATPPEPEPSVDQPALSVEPPASAAPLVDDDNVSPSSLQALNVMDSTQTTASLRARPSASSGATDASSHSTARAALFAGRSKAAAPQTSTATAEAMLDRQRAEQDALSESILRMAGALKASSQRFSLTLEADKEVVGRAGEGIDRTERGMDAARGRMGSLKKLTEGKGWWGRMILYAWVYGLMVLLVLLVFAMPKLRF